MLIRHATLEDVQTAAESIGCRFEGTESGVRFPRVNGRLMPPRGIENPYPRVSASYFGQGRRVHAVCWHGFRDFYRALFELCPDATVQSVLTQRAGIDRYTAENFERVFPDTGCVNIGAPISPVHSSEACSCPEGSF